MKHHEIRLMRLTDLKPAPYNPRTLSKEAAAGLTESLSRFGLVDPLIVNKRTGYTIVGGHQRYAIMQQQGIDEAQVVLVDLSEVEERALNVTLNNPHIAGDWSDDLASLLDQIRHDGAVDFGAIGLAKLLEELTLPLRQGNTDPDSVPEPPDKPETQNGDRIVLGDHVLMCGDSSDAAQLDRLLDGSPIHLVNTDPPYNVKVEPRSNNAILSGNSSFSLGKNQSFDSGRRSIKTKGKMRAKDRPLDNDNITDAEFDQRLRSWFGNISRVLMPGRGFYIWGGYANYTNYPIALAECDLYFSQLIIWVKGWPVLNRKDYMNNHESCFYGWKKGSAHYFKPNLNNELDVWEIRKVTPMKMVHLTEKPVELAVRAIGNSSRVNENVLDIFGGSGSTLIAAEQNERNAYLMELDPAYCDVIIKRWEDFTGRKAKRTRAT